MTNRDGLRTPEDLKPFDPDEQLGLPGEYPFTRGIYPRMYRERSWTMRQYSGFGDARQTNKRFRYLLEQGQTGLSVAFDLPTQLGYDSDHPLAAGEVGRVGVAVSTVEDLAELFEDIPLDRVSTSMTINATAPILLAMFVTLAKRTGIDPKNLQGTVQNDILKEYLARGNYIYPVTPSIRLAMDLWEYCIANIPRWNYVSVSGYHIREAGATAVQELAFTFADALCYVDAAVARGLAIDTFAPRISFFFGAHNHLLEEAAKFRAARRIWARLMREKYRARSERSCKLRFHTQTCGSTLTAQQPENNIIRVSLQALAAIFGGTQSLHTNSYDEALALPSERASTIALRTQQVIAHESGVRNEIDPMAGSYTIESMTNRIESGVMDLLEEIASQGGAVKCLENGFMKSQIEESAYMQQRRMESGEDVVVGVNAFEMERAQRIDLLKVSKALEKRRRRGMASYRSSRNERNKDRAIMKLIDAARGNENVMPRIMDCIGSAATLGEISDAFREVFGSYDR